MGGWVGAIAATSLTWIGFGVSALIWAAVDKSQVRADVVRCSIFYAFLLGAFAPAIPVAALYEDFAIVARALTAISASYAVGYIVAHIEREESRRRAFEERVRLRLDELEGECRALGKSTWGNDYQPRFSQERLPD